MPSIWCPNCQFNKHRETKCPQCGFVEEGTSKTYKVPNIKPARILNGSQHNKINKELYNQNFSHLTKNPIILGLFLVIAISVGYLAFTKYQENRQNTKLMEAFLGTSDPDEIREHFIKQLKVSNEDLDKMMIDSEKKQKELIEKALLNNNNN